MHRLLNLALAGAVTVAAVIPAYGNGDSDYNGQYQSGSSYSQQNGYINANPADSSAPALSGSRNDSQEYSYKPFANAEQAAHHHGLRSALGGIGRAIGRTAQVAAPVAGGMMMMRAANNMMIGPGVMGASGGASTASNGAKGVTPAAGQGVVYGMPVAVPGGLPVYQTYPPAYPVYGYTTGQGALMNTAVNMLTNH